MEALDPALFEDDNEPLAEEAEDDSVDGVTPSADWQDFSAPV